MNTMVFSLSFAGKLDNLQSCAILTLHYSPPREQINNPVEEETAVPPLSGIKILPSFSS